MTGDHSAEVLHLRATVRDLLALSSIPEVWVGREPPAIAAELADVMIQSLQLDFAFVRLCDLTGCQMLLARALGPLRHFNLAHPKSLIP